MMKLWEREIYLQALLFNVENEAFEILSLGMVDIDGVIDGLCQLVEDTHTSSRAGCCGEDR